MKLPWVSRAAFEAAERHIERMQDHIVKMSEWNGQMVDRLMAMKKDGFNDPPDMAPPEIVTPLPQEVVIAITRRAQPNTPEFRQLTRTARLMVEAGQPVESVVDGILRGEEVAF